MPPAHPNPTLPRPCEFLAEAGQRYPRAWNQIAQFRADRGKDLPDWPDYVYAPMAAWYAAVSAEAGVSRLPLDRVHDVGLLSALGAWRMTTGIYRFDPDRGLLGPATKRKKSYARAERNPERQG